MKCIFFDMDGTLIDTEVPAAQILNESFLEWGIQLETADAQWVTGRTWESVFEFIFNKYSPPLSKEDALSRVVARYQKKLRETLPEVPGAKEAVLRLSKQYKCALVSGSHRKDIEWVLERMQIRSCFDFVLGAEDYAQSKPSPEGYLRAKTLLQDLYKKTVISGLVFEDSRAGIESGKKAGFKVAALTHCNHFNQDQSQADVLFGVWDQITIPWVQKILEK